MEERFLATSSPHIWGSVDTARVMRDVLIALAPATLAGAVFFGPRALLVCAVSVAACVLAEFLCRRVMKRPDSIGDLSAAVTGLLLALNMPPGIEPWKVAVGGAVAIVLVKQIFGGIGQNFMNPALAARVFLLMSWGASMTRWRAPNFASALAPSAQQASASAASGGGTGALGAGASAIADAAKAAAESLAAQAASGMGVDAVSAATPLAIAKEFFKNGDLIGPPAGYAQLFLGNVAGCIGETSAAALLLGAAYLLLRKVITWHIPAAYVATVALLMWAIGGRNGAFTGDALYHVLAGGLLLGAVFMATDYATSPMSSTGKLIMGVGCGALTVVIRLYAGYPEGVSFAILIMNVVVPLIDRFTVPVPFGGEKAHAR